MRAHCTSKSNGLPLSYVGICALGFVLCLVLAGGIWIAQQRVLARAEVATYTPLTGEAEWAGDWAFSEQGANPSEDGSQRGADRVTIPFVGTDFALQVRRGHYRGYFFVSVDGVQAPLLPRNERGAYLVLTAPDYTPQIDTIPVVRGLDDGPHEALVVAERGWDQWPLVGWRVGRTPDTRAHRWGLTVVAVLAVAFLIGAIGFASWSREAKYWQLETRVEGQDAGWPIWGAALIAAGVFYFSPWLPLALLGWLALAILIWRHLEIGLTLVMFTAPFYMHPRPLLGKSFAMAEVVLLTSFGTWIIHHLPSLLSSLSSRLFNLSSDSSRLSPLDGGILFFLLVAIASTLAADYRHVALRELRVVVIEPALFYMMLRATPLGRRQVWRLVDGFVLGAVIVAVVGLVQYVLGVSVITAEQGFRRLRSVYGSPNNAGLYLGRVLPVLAAVAVFGATRWRRVAYGAAALPVGVAIVLSFSKGAILLGVPVPLLTLGVLVGGHWLWAAVGAVIVAAVLVVPLFSTPRFAALLDTRRGTTFFRLQLWRASWKMFLDHAGIGVGPDNFLYQYRGRYILPSAWREPNLSHPHNVFLDYGCRLGVPGLVAGAWFQMAFWRMALPLCRLATPDRRSADCRALALGLMASMVGFLVHGLVDASYFVIDLAFVFFMTLGVLQWLAIQKKEKEGGDAFEI